MRLSIYFLNITTAFTVTTVVHNFPSRTAALTVGVMVIMAGLWGATHQHVWRRSQAWLTLVFYTAALIEDS